MEYESKLKKYLNKLDKKEVYTYADIKLNLKIDDTKKLSYLMCKFHKNGFITKIDRAKFLVENEPLNELIFVYGSLKKGFDNHHVIKNAKYKCKAKTVSKFPMYEEEFANYPYLIKKRISNAYNVKGELYEIRRKELLKKLDKFEGAPDYYIRETIKVQTLSGEVKKAYAYFLKENKIPDSQNPMKEWKNNTDMYIEKFFSYYKQSII